MREEKTYNGALMATGAKNEECVIAWLNSRPQNRHIIDFREFKLAQRIDVDFGIESIDGDILLLEVKSDKWISETGNLCFEQHRINHFVPEKYFYLGWGWRSPAQKLLIRNPETGESFIFDFAYLRAQVARYISAHGKSCRVAIVETDKQKTTFNLLLPMRDLKFQKVFIPNLA
jgi:hypothetical protein